MSLVCRVCKTTFCDHDPADMLEVPDVPDKLSLSLPGADSALPTSLSPESAPDPDDVIRSRNERAVEAMPRLDPEQKKDRRTRADARCKCGHERGTHNALPPSACSLTATGECKCTAFDQKRKRKPTVAGIMAAGSGDPAGPTGQTDGVPEASRYGSLSSAPNAVDRRNLSPVGNGSQPAFGAGSSAFESQPGSQTLPDGAAVARDALNVEVPGSSPGPATNPVCGHPAAAIVSADEGTSFCGACARQSVALNSPYVVDRPPDPGAAVELNRAVLDPEIVALEQDLNDAPDRQTYLGSADIGMVAGVSPHGAMLDVFLRKTGLALKPDAEAEHLWIGRFLEPSIAAMYSDRTDRQLVKAKFMRHPSEPWAGATMDYIALHDLLNVEAKATFRFGVRYWPEDAEEPPMGIIGQSTWQVGIARANGLMLEATDVPRLLVTGSFRIYRVAWDEELFALLMERGRKFWHEHVLTGNPPPLDGSDAAAEYLRARYPKSKGNLLPATQEAAILCADYGRFKAEAQTWGQKAEERKQAIQALIGDADGIDGLCTWRSNARGSTDWKGVSEAMKPPAELIAKYQRPGARVFRVMGVKDEGGKK